MNSRRVHKEVGMEKLDTVISVFPDHDAAEHAIKTLAQAGFGLKSLSIIGHGYQREERVIGFYNVADQQRHLRATDIGFDIFRF